MALLISKELLEGRKLTLKEIEEIVVRDGFGVTPFDFKGYSCGMSHGINIAALSGSIDLAEIESALDRFLANDFGTFYDYDETPFPGREYGCYPSKFSDKPYEGAIMVHRENHPLTTWGIVVYFQFER